MRMDPRSHQRDAGEREHDVPEHQQHGRDGASERAEQHAGGTAAKHNKDRHEQTAHASEAARQRDERNREGSQPR
jgi:hypothetical protein